ncbi:MAG: endolytic transglycosylase MltG [Paraperlucidibaca sp.]
MSSLAVKNKPIRKRRWILMAILVVLAIIAYRIFLQSVTLPTEGVKLRVARGSSWQQVAMQLSDQGIIHSRWSLRAYLMLRPGEETLLPGVFNFRPPMTLEQLVARLSQAPDGTPAMLVIEGTRYRDLLATIAARDDVRHSVAEMSDAQVLAAIGADESHPEGLFAPDTYVMDDDSRDIDILRRLYLRQKRLLANEWAKRAADLPYKTPYEALIMASIIEKETSRSDERTRVAGVFVRRMKIGMRLQTDPTVIYGMGEAFRGNISRKDLRAATDYNTYHIAGLPPSPIALPSRASIHAALHPAEGDAIFFVADGQGRHIFSATLKDHNNAVNKYQR